MNMKTAWQKVKGYITRCNPGRSYENKGEGGWTPT